MGILASVLKSRIAFLRVNRHVFRLYPTLEHAYKIYKKFAIALEKEIACPHISDTEVLFITWEEYLHEQRRYGRACW